MTVRKPPDRRWGKPQSYTCPRGCGWYRNWKTSEEWARRIIAHPLYGPMKNIDLVTVDIDRHDCYDHKAAVRKLHATQREAA